MDLLIRLIIWIIKSIASEVKDAKTRRDLTAAGLDPRQVQVPANVPVAELKTQLQANVERRLSRIAEVITAGELAPGEAKALERDLADVPGGEAMLGILSEHIMPAFEEGIPALKESHRSASALPLQQAALRLDHDPALQAAWKQVTLANMRLGVLSALRDSRLDPADGLRLADADAIADALLSPLQEFAEAQDIGLPKERPIAAPARKGGEAIWMGLLPERYPILFVPADFLEDLYRYASVPHELGHLMWRDVPGLAREVYEAAGFQYARGLIGVRDNKLSGTLDQVFTPWMSEIFADMVAVLLLGPAALRGLMYSFASPEAPAAVLTAGVQGTNYDEHPPAHLRVHFAAHLLWTMGYDQQANAMKAEWDAQHGQPQRIFLPLAGGATAQMSVEMWLQPGREAIDRLYMHQFNALSGFRLADIPSFEMSPGLWARVLRRADQLAEDSPFNDDGRVVLAAAIEARTRHPARALLITRGLRRAILGQDSRERRVADPHYQRPDSSAQGWAEELRAALIFREVMERPAQRRARRR